MSATDETAIALFFDVYRRNQRYAQKTFGTHVPFHGQYRCLFLLEHRDEISQKELADLLQIRPASAGEIISKLEQKGFLTRKPSEKDRRILLVSLTPSGREEVKRAGTERNERHAKLLSPLSQQEKEQFCRLLSKIRNHYIEMEKKDENLNHSY